VLSAVEWRPCILAAVYQSVRREPADATAVRDQGCMANATCRTPTAFISMHNLYPMTTSQGAAPL